MLSAWAATGGGGRVTSSVQISGGNRCHSSAAHLETPAPMPPDLAAQPLAGLTVIDLSQIYNGPYATFLLAAAGATVIKVEPPGGELLPSLAAR